ncbi:MAG: acyl-CoA dehydrogenase family protein, partial [Actinobacteria bacterium]|nr:acyl-CoA dehydrogenase family protein [Actinomycetota bacterium]
MDFRDTHEEAEFRAELRAWLEANIPESHKQRGDVAGRGDEAVSREWSKKLHEAGYSGLTWPKEYGGAGAPYTYQAIFLE